MALTGFTNTLPMLKTHYQDDMMMEASRENPIQPYLSSNPSISVDKPRQIQPAQMTHGQGLLFLASLYKRNDNKPKQLAEISEENVSPKRNPPHKLYNERSRGNGYYDNTYVKMFNIRNSSEQKSPQEKGAANNIKRFKVVKLPEILNSPKVQNSPEERGAFGKLTTIFHK